MSPHGVGGALDGKLCFAGHGDLDMYVSMHSKKCKWDNHLKKQAYVYWQW